MRVNQIVSYRNVERVTYNWICPWIRLSRQGLKVLSVLADCGEMGVNTNKLEMEVLERNCNFLFWKLYLCRLQTKTTLLKLWNLLKSLLWRKANDIAIYFLHIYLHMFNIAYIYLYIYYKKSQKDKHFQGIQLYNSPSGCA